VIRIDIDDRDVTDALGDLARRTGDLSPALRDIAGVMADAVEENFEQQGRPPWDDLSPATIGARLARGYWPGRILQQTGQLAASIQRESGADYALVGTNKVYAGIHQFGGRAGRGQKVEIPARPFLALGEDDEAEILDIVADYLRGALD
jgi:phage virion morphogenesis protein